MASTKNSGKDQGTKASSAGNATAAGTRQLDNKSTRVPGADDADSRSGFFEKFDALTGLPLPLVKFASLDKVQ